MNTTMIPHMLPYPLVGSSDVWLIDVATMMQQAFGFSPFACQEDVLTHLFKMISSRHPLGSVPTFFCQPTGGGK
jgi:hypothetical protein